MANKKQRVRRTKVKDLSKGRKELSKGEQKKVKGGLLVHEEPPPQPSSSSSSHLTCAVGAHYKTVTIE